MSESPKEITVRLKKGGWEVEIRCSEDHLKSALESVLGSIETAEPAAQVSLRGKAEESTKTCRGLVVDLWQESWFSEPRSLSLVHEEISRRGFHYDKTAVSHTLADLVREGILSRQGNMRNYVYIQKRPATAGPIETGPAAGTSSDKI